MSNRHPIKETVKVLYIMKANQKIRFQIRHPENVYAIIGIAVTCSLAIRRGRIEGWIDGGFEKGNSSATAGFLNLAIAEKGDVAFGEDVKIDNNDYSDAIEKIIYGFDYPKEQQYIGKGQSYFETNYLITEAILEGYYEDIFLQKNRFYQEAVQAIKFEPIKKELIGIDVPSKNQSYYKVSVYIRYQTLKPIDDEN